MLVARFRTSVRIEEKSEKASVAHHSKQALVCINGIAFGASEVPPDFGNLFQRDANNESRGRYEPCECGGNVETCFLHTLQKLIQRPVLMVTSLVYLRKLVLEILQSIRSCVAAVGYLRLH